MTYPYLLLSIDPGFVSSTTAWCVWRYGVLVDAGVAPTKERELGARIRDIASKVPSPFETGWGETGAEWAAVAAERMQYRGKNHPGNPQFEMDLNLLVGSIAGPNATYYRAIDWKRGNVPKAVNHARTRTILSLDELAVLSALKVTKKQELDVMDAAGIGLHHLGRDRQ